MIKSFVTIVLGIVMLGLIAWSGIRIATADPLNTWQDSGNDIHYNSGKVGIGDSAPSTSFAVSGVIRGAYNSDELEYVEIGHGGTNGYVNTAGDGRLDFRHDGSNLLSLTDAGYLGVGTTSPQDLIHLKNGQLRLSHEHLAPRIYFVDDEDNDQFTMLLHRSNNELQIDSSSADNIMVIEKTGKIGIGTANPASKLEVEGILTVDGSLRIKNNIVSDNNICIGNC